MYKFTKRELVDEFLIRHKGDKEEAIYKLLLYVEVLEKQLNGVIQAIDMDDGYNLIGRIKFDVLTHRKDD